MAAAMAPEKLMSVNMCQTIIRALYVTEPRKLGCQVTMEYAEFVEEAGKKI